MVETPEHPPGSTGDASPRVRKVAAFDFDGTVSRRDTLMPFVARFAGARRLLTGSSGAAWDALVRRTFNAKDRDVLKAEMLRRLLAGRDARALDREAGVYAARLIDGELRPEIVDEIRRHVAAGHETLFVSASLSDYLHPIARYLGMTDVIAVDLDVADGVLSGSMVHPNVRAAQKAVRLRSWLGAPPSGPLEGVELWAYGNSSGDHALLELATHAYWLGKPAACPSGAVPYSRAVAFERDVGFNREGP